MDIPLRLIIAFSIIAGVAIGLPIPIIASRRRRADGLRRRGVKSYNRGRQVSTAADTCR